MIKINLLPVRAHKKREQGRTWFVGFVLVVIGSLIGNYFWLSATSAKVKEIKKRIADDDAKNKDLEKIIGEVKDIKKEKEEMKQKLGVLNKLKAGRTGPVKVLDELSSVIPQRVWILSWDEVDGHVHIHAAAMTHDDVAGFMRKMKESKFFDGVELESDKMNGDHVDITVVCNVKYAA